MRSPLPLLALALLMGVPEGRAGSLWTREGNNEQGMFADRRAKNIGDILTIVVQENSTSTQAQEIKTYDKTNSGIGPVLNNLVNQFVAALPGVISASTGIKTSTDSAATAGSPILTLGTESKFNGGGTLTSRLTVSNRTAVTVVDVLPNGNLVVEGRKIVRAGKETQYAYLRGIVRAADVERDNTALSTNLADAQVEYIPEGELTEAQKKGWLLGIWDKVKPF